MENKRPGNRPRKITDQRDGWQWDRNKIAAKIIPAGEDDCWSWRGSRGPQGNLFGAYKLNERGIYQPQMTQANRMIARQHVDHSLEGYNIYMSCGNRSCTNFRHMQVVKVGSGRGKTST